MDVDAAASIRCWDTDLELGGRVFTIPARPAADWWPVLTGENLADVLDLIADAEDVDDLILTGSIPADEMREALTAAIEENAGRSVHAAMVLAISVQTSWAWAGPKYATSGFQWDVDPLGRALDLAYAIMIEGLSHSEDKDAVAKFERLLDNDGRKPDDQKMRQGFTSIAGPAPTGGVRSTGAPSDGARPRTRTQPRPPRLDDRSGEPMPRPGRPARNVPAAILAGRPGVAGPASGIEPPAPL